MVKEAFLAQDALAVVTALVAEPLARHPRMSQQDTLLVQLVITFFRNLLAIPDQFTSAGRSNYACPIQCVAQYLQLRTVLRDHAEA